ncbi:MAG: efflux RND transporter periplasmic adaptor subunit [Chitinophagales bacterium]|nr:efflux RND transporter periplasmic adaptor subunit [Chitinophagales bacterium]MDW8427288.1 efflux RND transporter periplasmic adaptor subunit [Chitinophagales bacterium]
MKQNLIMYLPVALILVGMNGCRPNDATSAAAELERLRKQKQELEQRIQALEATLGEKKADDERRVATVEIAPTLFVSYIEVQGTLEADQNVWVTPLMPGLVRKVHVRTGQAVQKGQLLAELDNEALKRNLEALERQLQLARSLYEKQRMLWEQKVGTEVQYLTAKTNMETLEQQVAAAREQVEQTNLTSPIDGTIDEINMKVGELASAGLSGIRVVNTRQLKVVAEVSEAYSGRITNGLPARIIFPDLVLELPAKLSYVGKVIKPQSRTFRVECHLPANEQLKPNMVAIVRIIDYEKTNAISIDVNLLQQAKEGYYVMVAVPEQGRWIAQRLAVQVGRIFNGQAEILSGLKPGDRLITAGSLDVVAGQPLQLDM